MSQNVIARPESNASSANRQTAVRFWLLVQRNLLAVLAISFILLWLLFVVWHSIPFASLETDGMEYIATAKSLFTTHFTYSSYHGIGFPIALWLVHLLVPNWFIAAQVVSGIAGLVLVLGTFRMMEALADRTAATLSAILVVSNFFVIAYSGMAMSDMLAAALGLVAPIVLLRSSKMSRYAWAGLLAGLAADTRYQFFALGAGAFAGLVLEKDNRARLKAAMLYLGAFGLAVLPFLVLNWLTFGNPLFNSNYTLVGMWISSAPSGQQFDSWGGIANAVASDPKFVVFRYLKKIGFDVPLFLVHVVYYSIFFAVPGWLLASNRLDSWKKLLVPAVFFLAYVLVTSIGWLGSERYWLYLVPFIAGGAALFVSQLSENRSWLGMGLMALLVLVNVAGVANNLPDFAAEQATEFKRAGEFLSSQTGANDMLLVSQPQIGYLADRPNVLYRDVPQKWSDLDGIISKYGIRYVEMDERYGTGHYPDLVNLLDPAQVSQTFPNWQLVYSDSKSPRIVIYRVTGK